MPEAGHVVGVDTGNRPAWDNRVEQAKMIGQDGRLRPHIKMIEDLRNTALLIDNLDHEIAERVRAETALRQSEERFRQVAENAGEWIWEVDAEGRYTYCNRTIEKMLGYGVDEAVGKMYFYDFIAPQDRDPFKKAAFATFEKRERFAGLINANIRKDGTTVLLETNAWPIVDDQDILRGYRGVDIDVTERKTLEERQARLLVQLEQTNQQLKDFAHVVSHDLKAPLRGIKTLAEWIAKDYGDKLDDAGRSQIQLLVGRVERMHCLIHGILRYSEAGEAEEEQTTVCLDDLLPEIVDTVSPPGHITVTIDGPLPAICGETTRVTQVFQNLIGNAVKYMDKPRGRIRIGCAEEDGFWRFSVSDNGPGIDRKYFERIFNLFQTVSPHGDQESTGVGLAIVKKIVEKYGGRIWVQSQVKEGSTFLFTWPKSPEAAAREASKAGTVG
jgi:two-component system, LuxR family, sensor kinase FixL